MSTVNILVLYYSRTGATAEFARQVCRGVESVDGATAVLRSTPPVTADDEHPVRAVPDSGAPWVKHDDLRQCDGLLLGSPTRFGNMAAALKYFLDGAAAIWAEGALVGKPAGVFTGSSSLHGGQESTLLTMMVPLLHHGMVITGVPYTESALSETRSGGGPYGASHFTPHGTAVTFTDHEKRIAHALGARVAQLAIDLKDRRVSRARTAR